MPTSKDIDAFLARYPEGVRETAAAARTLLKSHLKLGIFRGSELPDPKALMAGEGKVHRHVQLRTAADTNKAGLSQLLKAALAAWQQRAAAAR